MEIWKWKSLKIKMQNDEHETFQWSFLVGLHDMVKVCSDIFKKHTVFVFRISGCETGVLKESIIHRLSVFESKILRKIFGSTKEDNGNWRIKTNIEFDELIRHRNIINYVKAQRLSSFGHISRMPETSIVKKIYKWKPLTGRPVGRPKSRWEDDVRNELKKMKLIKWT